MNQKFTSDDRSRRDLLRGAITAGVFVVTVNGTASGAVAANGETTRGFLRKTDFYSGYGLETLVMTSDVVNDVALEPLGGGTETIRTANVLQRGIMESNDTEESVDGINAQKTWTQGAEFWPLSGASEVGTWMKITNADEYPSEGTVKLLGPDGPIESTTVPIMKVTLEEIKPAE